MSGVGDRRRAFAWLDLEALDWIDQHASASVAAGVHNVYLALARMAARRMDGEHAGFEATRQELAAVARTSTKTIDRHVAELQRLRLVAVEERTTQSGATLPSRYLLVDPPRADDKTEIPGGRHHVAPPGDIMSRGGDTVGAELSPPTCARPDAVEEKEEGERERARGHDQDELEEAQSEPERGVTAELTELLAGRGDRLSAADRLAIRGVLRNIPDGVDPVAAAGRLSRNYGPGGKAEHRTIGDIARVLKAEIAQSSTERAAPERPSTGRGRRGRRDHTPTLGAPPPRLRQHTSVPAGIDEPTPEISQTWQRARTALQEAVNDTTWDIYLSQLDLAGTMTMLVDEAGGDSGQPERTVMLDGPPEVVSWAATRFERLLSAVIAQAFGENVTVELACTIANAKTRPVAAA